MNIQQLQYVIAVDDKRHFQKAAEACFVTPATLSIMLKKLEEELDLVIFDRTKYPIVPTERGKIVIQNARDILSAVDKMHYDVKYAFEEKSVSGELQIGIIPTLAPYLLHHFLPAILEKYPGITIQLKELRTFQVKDYLRKDMIDVGIIALQNESKEFKTRSLFHEKLLIYAPDTDAIPDKKYILSDEIDVNKLWLLEEEHCLRSQVMDLCSLKEKMADQDQLKFEAGSIETLLNLVEMMKGITIIPELATIDFSTIRKNGVRQFADPVPSREIGLITYRPFVKENLIDILENEIKNAMQHVITSC